ncbi:MAG: EAL domain-containing protein [Marinobacterium sp.]|nr:EAL domain-containing protein [Marinobacterium sp.]
MRSLRFSTVLLGLVFLLLAVVSSILLSSAYLGAQRALQQEIVQGYERDQRTLASLLSEQFDNIYQISHELIEVNDLSLALENNDHITIRAIIDSLLDGDSGQRIDAVVVTRSSGELVEVRNTGIINLDLPLNRISRQFQNPNTWHSTHEQVNDQDFHLMRLTLPIIEPELGEVIGQLNTYVLLNNNYWLMNQLQELFGSQAISLSHAGIALGGLERQPGELDFLRAPDLIVDGVQSDKHYILRDHDLRIDNTEMFSIRMLFPNSAFMALQDTYMGTLTHAALAVVVFGFLTMWVIYKLTRRSLAQLTDYAEQVPESGAPVTFAGAHFDEFSRVGRALELMLLRIRDRDKRLASIIDNSPDMIFIKDLNHRYRLINKQMADVLGLPPEQILGQLDRQILHKEVMNVVSNSDQEMLANGEPIRYELKMDSPTGKTNLLMSKFPIVDDHGVPYAIGGIATDITAMKQTEEQLKLAHQVFEETAEAILVLDDKKNILTTNRAFTEISGFTDQDESVTVLAFLNSNPESQSAFSGQGRWQGECLLRRHDGDEVPVLVSITPVLAPEMQSRFVLLFTDITELKAAETRLERLALYDSLTGLPNRSLFYQRLEQSLNLPRNGGWDTAIMFLDLDRFKSINDTYGHNTGDALLQQVADRLRACVGPMDTVARLGGDEFTIIVREIRNLSQLKSIAHRILTTVREPYDLGSIRCFTSTSIGIAIVHTDGTDTETLTRHADLAMYQAKERGRNLVQFFDETLNAQNQQRHQLEEGLRAALEKEELFLHYQPRFDIDGEYVVGAEALLRWQPHGQDPVSPGVFIPIAEDSNLIVEIGRFVLKEACKAAAHWNQNGSNIPVSVNLSPRQLRDQYLLHDLEQALNEAGLPAHLLELEITETHVMENIDEVIHTLDLIRAMDISLSVDDFGTGYSSLVYLKKLPVNTVKIDQSFVRDVPEDDDDAVLIQAIIRMSHSLRLNVVAEGVETRAQQSFLRAAGCDELQGFLLGRPGTVESLMEIAGLHAPDESQETSLEASTET